MDRIIVYPAQIPLETHLLNMAKNVMIALAKMSAAAFGTTTSVNGLTVSPTAPASMTVTVAAGEIYALANIDDTAFSSLAADTAHQILKQGISLDPVSLNCPAPATAGQSINYLVQAAFSEVDTGNTVLPYYNSANPATAFSGPNNSGQAQATLRQGKISIAAKAGAAAATGSQVTPAPDSGYVPLYVVTVANGQASIGASNITASASAPFINSTVLSSNPQFANAIQAKNPVPLAQAQSMFAPIIGASRNARMTLNAASATATFTADQLIVGSALDGQTYHLANLSLASNLATVGAGGMDTGSAPASSYIGDYVIFNPTTGDKKLLSVAAPGLLPEVCASANMPAGYTASALVSIWPTTAAGLRDVGIMIDRTFCGAESTVITTTATMSPTAVSVAVPTNAKTLIASGQITADSGASGTRLDVFSNAQQLNRRTVQCGTTTSIVVPISDIMLTTPKTVYIGISRVSGTGSAQLVNIGYKF